MNPFRTAVQSERHVQLEYDKVANLNLFGSIRIEQLLSIGYPNYTRVKEKKRKKLIYTLTMFISAIIVCPKQITMYSGPLDATTPKDDETHDERH